MIAILENLGLDDGHQPVGLTYWSISRQLFGILINRRFGGAAVTNLEDGPPLRKPASHLIILRAALTKVVEALGDRLVICSANCGETDIDLDATMDVSVSEYFCKSNSAFGRIFHRLIEHDDAANVLAEAGRCEQQFPICLSIWVVVLHIDLVKSFANCSCRLVGCQNTLSWCADFLRSLNQLFRENATGMAFRVCAFKEPFLDWRIEDDFKIVVSHRRALASFSTHRNDAVVKIRLIN